jgi:hypothetical protein
MNAIPVNDTSGVGPFQSIVALDDGFGIAVTLGGRNVRAGGASDVAFVVVGDRGKV